MPKVAARILMFAFTAVMAAALGWAGLGPLADPGAGEPVWWPLSGFGAVMLVFGSRRFWPWIVSGLVAGSTKSTIGAEPSQVNQAGLVAGLAENLLIALLLRRLRPRSALDESLLDAVRVLVCVLAGSAVASLVFAGIGAPGREEFFDLWSEFARNHLLGLMLVSPCLALSIDRDELRAELRDHRANLEWLAQLAITLACTAVVFLTYQHIIGSSLLVLPLIWGALRLGPLRAMISLLLSSTMATIGTNNGLGRIAALDSPADEVVTLQVAIGVLALTTMVTAIVGRLRERAMALVQQRTFDLNTAERLAGIGSARWIVSTGKTIWSDGLHRLLGTDPATDEPGVRTYLSRVHPDDLERVTADVAALAAQGRADTIGYRIVRTDGQVRDVVIRMIVEHRPNGRVHQTFLTVQDVTEARAAQAELTKAHGELAAVLDAVTGTAILGTAGGTISFFNRGAENLFGYSADEAIGKLTALDLHDPVDLERMTAEGTGPEVIVETVQREGTFTTQCRFARQDGSTFPGQLTITARSGSLLGFIGVITDLTGVLQAQEELAESEKRFRLAFDTSPMGMAVVSLSPTEPGRFLRVNDALCEFAGVSESQLLGSQVGDFLGDGEHLQEAMSNLVDLMYGGLDRVTSERLLLRPDGGQRWGRVSVSAVRPGRGRDPYMILLVENITASKALTEQLQHEAAHDSLTGLPNRLHLHRQLDRELQERRSGKVALLYLDLDGFKAVNDSKGHGAGDELLIQVADRIAASVRGSDVVARLGGDEFAVLCPGVPDVETAMRIGRSILASLSREFDLSETRARVGASIGVAVALDGESGPELLHAADQAMYAAKREGKGSVRLNLR